jgi:hypothetical protein
MSVSVLSTGSLHSAKKPENDLWKLIELFPNKPIHQGYTKLTGTI